jgi:hypothetical protein
MEAPSIVIKKERKSSSSRMVRDDDEFQGSYEAEISTPVWHLNPCFCAHVWPFGLVNLHRNICNVTLTRDKEGQTRRGKTSKRAYSLVRSALVLSSMLPQLYD